MSSGFQGAPLTTHENKNMYKKIILKNIKTVAKLLDKIKLG